jgi:hypothetical protein
MLYVMNVNLFDEEWKSHEGTQDIEIGHSFSAAG